MNMDMDMKWKNKERTEKIERKRKRKKERGGLGPLLDWVRLRLTIQEESYSRTSPQPNKVGLGQPVVLTGCSIKGRERKAERYSPISLPLYQVKLGLSSHLNWLDGLLGGGRERERRRKGNHLPPLLLTKWVWGWLWLDECIKMSGSERGERKREIGKQRLTSYP